MVESKENYKFDVGVKGLTDLRGLFEEQACNQNIHSLHDTV